MFYTKVFVIVVLAATFNLQANGDKVEEKAALDSVQNLRKQVNDLLQSVNKLLNNDAVSTILNQLNIIGANITLIEASSNQAVDLAISKLNDTINGIYNGFVNLQKNASDQGYDVSNCTDTLSADIANLTAGYMIGIADCPINIAAKGINMINNDVQYVTYISNIINTLPSNITACNWKAQCLTPIVTTYGPILANVPLQFTKMSAELSTYTSTLQAQIATCITAAVAQSTLDVGTWSANMTLCIGKETGNKIGNKVQSNFF